ncbi:MAG: hypothetical protein IT454_04535 [Planctomycetes bacterium]|nr:hypothetical protein [Planctomycetota bacterium]
MGIKRFVNDASHKDVCPKDCSICRQATDPVPNDQPTQWCCTCTNGGDQLDIYVPLPIPELMIAADQGGPSRRKSRTAKIVRPRARGKQELAVVGGEGERAKRAATGKRAPSKLAKDKLAKGKRAAGKPGKASKHGKAKPKTAQDRRAPAAAKPSTRRRR